MPIQNCKEYWSLMVVHSTGTCNNFPISVLCVLFVTQATHKSSGFLWHMYPFIKIHSVVSQKIEILVLLRALELQNRSEYNSEVKSE